tara:strand:- start:2622 stop:2798 length:177 start_codon:yes stop_codon:yes gene_type:complete
VKIATVKAPAALFSSASSLLSQSIAAGASASGVANTQTDEMERPLLVNSTLYPSENPF